MGAFTHFGTLIVVSGVLGFTIPKLGFGPFVNIGLCVVLGLFLGLVWRKVTGYKDES